MDQIYAVQRHFYDATRKYYLLGRDRLIRELDVVEGQSILEVGCGTGRNLAAIARRYPGVQLYGIDISAEMLKSAQKNVAPAAHRTRLACADATAFDPFALFGVARFDRVVLSYMLSMVPDWQAVLETSAAALSPGGRIHIVDFGDQAGFPILFGRALRSWLAKFDVTPRAALYEECRRLAAQCGLRCTTTSLYRGYAESIILLA
jgi:S-adenosylmethionine-diacylgycerolhomoserine-N-methlytransferase